MSALRAEHGDDFALATMRNHWERYYTDAELDAAQALGVNSVRIPVGFWIMDKCDGCDSPEEYGFSPEGFVTGGLIHLKRMLVNLRMCERSSPAPTPLLLRGAQASAAERPHV